MCLDPFAQNKLKDLSNQNLSTLQDYWEAVVKTLTGASYRDIADCLYMLIEQSSKETSLEYFNRAKTIFNRVKDYKTPQEFLKKVKYGLRDPKFRHMVLYDPLLLDENTLTFETLRERVMALEGIEQSSTIHRSLLRSTTQPMAPQITAQPTQNGSDTPMDIGYSRNFKFRGRGRRPFRGRFRARGRGFNRGRGGGSRSFYHMETEDDEQTEEEAYYTYDYEEEEMDQTDQNFGEGETLGNHVNAVNQTSTGTRPKSGKCFRCNNFGHWQNECPQNQRPRPSFNFRGTPPSRPRFDTSRGRAFTGKSRATRRPYRTTNYVTTVEDDEERLVQEDENEQGIYNLQNLRIYTLTADTPPYELEEVTDDSDSVETSDEEIQLISDSEEENQRNQPNVTITIMESDPENDDEQEDAEQEDVDPENTTQEEESDEEEINYNLKVETKETYTEENKDAKEENSDNEELEWQVELMKRCRDAEKMQRALDSENPQNEMEGRQTQKTQTEEECCGKNAQRKENESQRNEEKKENPQNETEENESQRNKETQKSTTVPSPNTVTQESQNNVSSTVSQSPTHSQSPSPKRRRTTSSECSLHSESDEDQHLTCAPDFGYCKQGPGFQTHLCTPHNPDAPPTSLWHIMPYCEENALRDTLKCLKSFHKSRLGKKRRQTMDEVQAHLDDIKDKVAKWLYASHADNPYWDHDNQIPKELSETSRKELSFLIAEDVTINILNRDYGYDEDYQKPVARKALKRDLRLLTYGPVQTIRSTLEKWDLDAWKTLKEENTMFQPHGKHQENWLLKTRMKPEVKDFINTLINLLPGLVAQSSEDHLTLAEGNNQKTNKERFRTVIQTCLQTCLPEVNETGYLATSDDGTRHTLKGKMWNECYTEILTSIYKQVNEDPKGFLFRILTRGDTTELRDMFTARKVATLTMDKLDEWSNPENHTLDTWLGTTNQNSFFAIREWMRNNNINNLQELSAVLRTPKDPKYQTWFAETMAESKHEELEPWETHVYPSQADQANTDIPENCVIANLDTFTKPKFHTLSSHEVLLCHAPASNIIQYSNRVKHLYYNHEERSRNYTSTLSKGTLELKLCCKIQGNCRQEVQKILYELDVITAVRTAKLKQEDANPEDIATSPTHIQEQEKNRKREKNLLEDVKQYIELDAQLEETKQKLKTAFFSTNSCQSQTKKHKATYSRKSQDLNDCPCHTSNIREVNHIYFKNTPYQQGNPQSDTEKEEAAFCKIRLYSTEQSKAYIDEFPLIDNGNLSGDCLISLATYNRSFGGRSKALRPSSTKKRIFAAGCKQLGIIGRAPVQMKFQFNDHLNPKVKLNYLCRPLIVKDLGVPVILSNHDIITLKGLIDPDGQSFKIPINQAKTIFCDVKMIPRSSDVIYPADVALIGKTTTIQPNEAKVVNVTTKSPDGTEVIIHTNSESSDFLRTRIPNHELMFTDTVDKVTNGFVKYCLINNGKEPITLEKNVPIGNVVSILHERKRLVNYLNNNPPNEQERMDPPIPPDNHPNDEGTSREFELSKVLQTMATTAQKPKQARDFDELEDPKTAEELQERLKVDLGFKNPKEIQEKGFTKDQTDKIVNKFAQNRPALALSYNDLGEVKGVVMKLPTGDSPPISNKNRPTPPYLQDVEEQQILRWLSQGVITISDGPWSSPLVIVPKGYGGYRVCIDYRKLNAVTVADATPVANMSEKLALVQGTSTKPLKFFASFDLSEAYHSIKIDEEDQEKTTFSSRKGNYKFLRMPFGLKTAPAVFQKVVNKLEAAIEKKVGKEESKHFLNYFDDTLIVASTFEELESRCDVYLKTVAEIGLKVQPRKTVFTTKSVKWLGITLSEQGIKPDPDRTRALDDWPTPKTVRDVASFMGLCNTFRSFIHNYAEKTRNIRLLLKRGKDGDFSNPIEWTPECEAEKTNLLKILTSEPILGHADFSKNSEPFILTCDTSKTGIGCTLSQPQTVLVNGEPKKKEVILSYWSKRLSPTEGTYASYRLELFGIKCAIKAHPFYLKGRRFEVRTDHRGLEYIMKATANQSTPSQIIRYQTDLSDYDFKIVYYPATRLRCADALSRRKYEPGENGTMGTDQPIRSTHVMGPEDVPYTYMKKLSSEDAEAWNRIFDQKQSKEKTTNMIYMVQTRSMSSESETTTLPSRTRRKKKLSPPVNDTKDSSEEDLTPKPPISPDFNTGVLDLENRESDPQADSESFEVIPDSETEYLTQDSGHSNKQCVNLEDTQTPTLTDSETLKMLKELAEEGLTVMRKKTQESNKEEFEKLIAAQQATDPTLKVASWLMSTPEWKRTKILTNNTYIRDKIHEEYQASKFSQKTKDAVPLFVEPEVQMVKILFNNHNKGLVTWDKNLLMRFQGRIVIPRSQRLQILEKTHSCRNLTDPSQKTNKHQIAAFWWYSQERDVSTFVNECVFCQRGKRQGNVRPSTSTMGKTSSLSLERLTTFAMDTIHMPPSRGPHPFNYLLVVQEISSGWIEAKALRHCNGTEVNKFLREEIFPRYQQGLRFVMDGGSEFNNAQVKNTITEMNSTYHFKTPHHPNSNPVERWNLVIGNLIRTLRARTQTPVKDWDKLLPDVLATIRCMKDDSGDSPYLRVFGRIPVLETDVAFGFPTNVIPETPASATTTVPFSRYQGVKSSPWEPEIQEHQPVTEEIELDNDHFLQIKRNWLNGYSDSTAYEKFKTPTGTPCLLERATPLVYATFVNQETQEVISMAQHKKNCLREKHHQRNLRQLKHNHKPWCPIIGLLVDWYKSQDAESTNNRKMAMKLTGCFRINKLENAYTAIIQAIDQENFDLIGREYQVNVNDLRPSCLAKRLVKKNTYLAACLSEDNNDSKFEPPRRYQTTYPFKRGIGRGRPHFTTRGRRRPQNFNHPSSDGSSLDNSESCQPVFGYKWH